jgi:hypothetical protein
MTPTTPACEGDDQCCLLLNFEDGFVDASQGMGGSPHTATVLDGSIDGAHYKFGTHGMLFGATTPAATYGSSPDWQLGTNWTIAFWWWAAALPSSGSEYRFVSNYQSATMSFWMGIKNTAGVYSLHAEQKNTDGDWTWDSGAITIGTSQWIHVELDDANQTLRGFINGLLVGTPRASTTMAYNTGAMTLGDALGGGKSPNGSTIDSLVIYRDKYLHIQSFALPDLPYSPCLPPRWNLGVVTTGASQDFKVVLAGTTVSITVNWGDTTADTYITAGTKTHTYALAGTYLVEIRGTLTGTGSVVFFTATGNTSNKIAWTSPINQVRGITNVTAMFRDNTNSAFTGLPDRMFAECPEIAVTAAFNTTFYGCSRLLTVPEDLFAYSPYLTSDAFTNTFGTCVKLNGLPANLFRQNIRVSTTAFSSTFTGCTGLTAVTDGLFRYNVLVSTGAFTNTFYNCSGITTTLPSDLFRYNVAVSTTAFNQTFYGCTGIASLPETLFKWNVAMTTSGFSSTFYGCTGITSLPSNLFRYNVAMTSTGFYQTFALCSSLASLPSDLFQYNVAVSTTAFNQTFYGCTGIASLPETLFKWNVAMTTSGFSSTFYGCTGITSLPSNLFRYNVAMTSTGFYQTFALCSSLVSLPSDLFQYNTALTTGAFNRTFGYCYALASVPTDLFRYVTGLTTTSFQYTFYQCTNAAFTSIPATLFSACVNATSYDSTFMGCTKLTAIPSALLDHGKTVITTVTRMFSGCTSLDGNAPTWWDAGQWTLISAYTDCFKSDTGLDNWADIPNSWKGL